MNLCKEILKVMKERSELVPKRFKFHSYEVEEDVMNSLLGKRDF